MAIGERIHFLRNLRGMTQKALGLMMGFPVNAADVRIAQYETGARTPKADVTAKLADILDVSPSTLNVPDIDSYVGLMHTLFTLEDLYGFKAVEVDGEVHLRMDSSSPNTKSFLAIYPMLTAWQEQAVKLRKGEITQEQYDQWRYRYPQLDTSQKWVKVPSQFISDMMADIGKK